MAMGHDVEALRGEVVLVFQGAASLRKHFQYLEDEQLVHLPCRRTREVETETA